MLVTKGMPRGHLAALLISYTLLLGTGLYVAMTRAHDGTGALGGAVILIIIIPMLLAQSAKSPAKSAALPERQVTITSPLSPDAVFAKLAGSKFGKIAPHDADAERRAVVYSSPIGGLSYGHFYPVFVRGAGTGSIVEVGITPKSVDCAPSLRKALDACAGEIKNAIAA